MENNKELLLEVVKQIHIDCFRLCKMAVGKYLPVAGNMGVFTHSEEEFEKFIKIREELCHPSDNPKTKYFELKEKLIIPADRDIPETTYTHLYIKKPEKDLPERGDIDFILSKDEYQKLKERILQGETLQAAKIYDRPGWDMIELAADGINSYGYITYREMAEKARVRFD